MKKVILHIGLPKTGTTTLQNEVFSKQKNHLFCYNPPKIIRALVEAILLLDFGMLEERDIERLRDLLDVELDELTSEVVFISNELLSMRLHRFDCKNRATFLVKIFPQAIISIVFRHQPELLRSLYQQSVAQGYLLEPKDVFKPFCSSVFVENDVWKKSMEIDIEQWDYSEAIRVYRKHFGTKFYFFFFEHYKEDLAKLGQELLNIVGVSNSSLTPSEIVTKRNISMNQVSVDLLFNVARQGIAFNSMKGFDSVHMHDLHRRAMNARYVFDSKNLEEFTIRLNKRPNVAKARLSLFEKNLFAAIRSHSKLQIQQGRSVNFTLPENIANYISQRSDAINTGLNDLVGPRQLPEVYKTKNVSS